MKSNMTLMMQRIHWLYKQFVTFVCNGYTIAPLTDYANNPTYQDLTTADKYFSSDEKMYLEEDLKFIPMS